MANVNIVKALERASKDIGKAAKQINLYSGVGDGEKRQQIEMLATAIVQQAADIVASVNLADGNKRGKTLVKRIRRELGYTYP